MAAYNKTRIMAKCEKIIIKAQFIFKPDIGGPGELSTALNFYSKNTVNLANQFFLLALSILKKHVNLTLQIANQSRF